MAHASRVIAGVGLADQHRKSRWPARMDLAQSVSGLVLGLFMWGHMFFVSSILVSKDFMWTITRMFEGYFFVGRAFPGIVSVIVFAIVMFVVLHAFLAMRKFPANYRQYRLFMGHRNLLRHEDTTLWWVQVVTGRHPDSIQHPKQQGEKVRRIIEALPALTLADLDPDAVTDAINGFTTQGCDEPTLIATSTRRSYVIAIKDFAN